MLIALPTFLSSKRRLTRSILSYMSSAAASLAMNNSMSQHLSYVSGPTSNPLWSLTLGALAEIQSEAFGDRTALVFPWQNVRRTYRELLSRSNTISKALLESHLQYGDCVGIFAGNCSEYLEVFLGASFIGCPVVVLNSNYTPPELESTVGYSECKLVCIARYPGPNRDTTPHLEKLRQSRKGVELIILDDENYALQNSAHVATFREFYQRGVSSQMTEVALARSKSRVRASDSLNYQFTSGTTGSPKASMLSHVNLINNGKYMGDALGLTTDDIICCPPPLFHCFGLVMGFLGAFTRGCTIVFPSQQFEAGLVVDAIDAERCTVLYGVPTMFGAELEVLARTNRKLTSLTTALAAGSPVPPPMVNRLRREMGIENVLIAYGMTETSPVTFATTIHDSPEHRLSTVGAVFPHTKAKIIDVEGRIVPRGVRGEICTSGYSLQKGYLRDVVRTKEVMLTDEEGTIWMHTGDEGVIDAEGYCRVTGRLKDMIIRGGENITPIEIEERLLSHQCITEAAVIGVPHHKYGEQVVAFVRQAESASRPSNADIAAWVREALARHKAPEHTFWVGDEGVGEDFPKTASGKHQKHILKDIAVALLRPSAERAKL